MQGYIKLFRQLAENDLWLIKPFSEGQAWIDLLLITTFDKGFIKTKNGQLIELKRGDCGFSQLSLSNRWGWSRGKVKRFLDLLLKLEMIQQKIYGNYTIISILNFDKFQNDTINNTINRTINGQQIEQQTDTINNVKNVENVKNVHPPIIPQENFSCEREEEVEVIKNDPYIDPLIDECLKVYSENCPDLCKLRFERRNRVIRELTAQVLTEIDRDIGTFKELCLKANELKTIVDKPIDYKKMLNCYQGILNGAYQEREEKSAADLFLEKMRRGEC